MSLGIQNVIMPEMLEINYENKKTTYLPVFRTENKTEIIYLFYGASWVVQLHICKIKALFTCLINLNYLFREAIDVLNVGVLDPT